jgi:predicted RNA binding protein YcfA (HicA-like mRNA interferase family)
MKQISGKELTKILEKHGWKLARIHGSHYIYTKSEVTEIITIPVHGNKPLGPGILKRALKISRIEDNEI